MTPTVGRDGRFAKRSSETRHLGCAGHSPTSRIWPATVLMISARQRPGEDPSRSAVAAYRAGCASLCRRGCFVAGWQLGSRFTLVRHSVRQGRTRARFGSWCSLPAQAVRSFPTGRSDRDRSRIPTASALGLKSWKSLTFLTSQRSCGLGTTVPVRDASRQRRFWSRPSSLRLRQYSRCRMVEEVEDSSVDPTKTPFGLIVQSTNTCRGRFPHSVAYRIGDPPCRSSRDGGSEGTLFRYGRW